MSERILVTGGAGFIASNVIRYFLEKTDYEIVTLDRIDSSADLSRIRQLVRDNPEYANRINVVWHDLKAELNTNVKNRIGKIVENNLENIKATEKKLLNLSKNHNKFNKRLKAYSMNR